MKKLLHYLSVLLILTLISGPLQAKKIDNLTVIVSSCDKYAELWHPFFTLLFKYWPSIEQQPIYLISNQKTYTDPRVTPVMIKNEKSWSDNLFVALEKTNDDYILLILDDYLINHVDVKRIENYIDVMKKEKAACLLLDKIQAYKTVHSEVKELGYLEKDAKYRTSLQVAIWDKTILKQLLVSGENPWEFELKGTERSKKIENPFFGLAECEKPISYLGAVFRGYWDPNAIALLEKENIKVDFQLPVCGKIRRFVMGPLRTFISVHFLQPCKEFFGITNILPVDV